MLFLKLHAAKNILGRHNNVARIHIYSWLMSKVTDRTKWRRREYRSLLPYNIPLDPRTLVENEAVFVMDASKIKILKDPKEFYEAIVEQISNADERIILSSLYIDDSNLLQVLNESLSKNYKLQVTILLDFHRSLRGGKTSSVATIKKLVDKYPYRINVFLYRAPALNEYMRGHIPDKFNEVFGSQHVKCYVFDNNMIMSGANLSREYFLNKQDRYYLFLDNPLITKFYSELIGIISDFSYKLKPGISYKHNDIKSTLDNSTLIINNATRKTINNEIRRHIAIWCSMTNTRNSSIDVKTPQNVLIIPLIQMKPHSISHESHFLKRMFLGLVHLAHKRSNYDDNRTYNISLSTAYFNLEPFLIYFINKLASYKHLNINITTSSPEKIGRAHV